MRFNDYLKFSKSSKLNEKTSSGKGLTIFDIDETLMRTYAQVHVIKNNKIIKKLSNQEFNDYQLQDGETFDFSEFRNADLFNKTSIPIQKNINKLISITKNATKVGSKVIMLTARADFDNKELFLNTFKKYGVPIDLIYVERAGNKMKPGDDIAKIKSKIISDYLETGEYRRVRLYDDFLKNCQEFLSLKEELPDEIYQKVRKKWNVPEEEYAIEFFAYLINSDGTAKRIK